MDGLDALKGRYLEGISGAGDEASLEEIRLAALGKKGEISLKMRELGQMASNLGLSAETLFETLFLSGMKFRNPASRQNYQKLSGGRVQLLKHDLLVGRPFVGIEDELRELLKK